MLGSPTEATYNASRSGYLPRRILEQPQFGGAGVVGGKEVEQLFVVEFQHADTD